VPRVGWQLIQPLFKVCAAALLGISLPGCLSPLRSPYEMAGVGPGDSVDSIRNADLVARYPASTGGQAILTGAPHSPELFPGAGTKPTPGASTALDGQPNEPQTGSPPPADGKAAGDGIEVNFENADIQTVAKSILSDTLGLNVLVDPRVQGSITLASSAPIPRKDLFAAFESVMRMSRLARGSDAKPFDDSRHRGRASERSRHDREF
jgi:general secretion pathway protein D